MTSTPTIPPHQTGRYVSSGMCLLSCAGRGSVVTNLSTPVHATPDAAVAVLVFDHQLRLSATGLKVATDLIDALSASPQGRGSAEGGGYCPVLLHSIPIPIPALGVPITQTLALGARSHQSSCFFANHHPAHNSHQDRRRGGVRQFMSTSLVPLSH